MRIGASTYSREPFPKQVDEVREAGFDYVELDLTWITWEPEKLRSEADALAKRLPIKTAHLPPSQFHQADLARFVGFIDALAPVGTEVFNAHFLEARSAPRIAPQAKTSWLSDLVDAATDRDVVVTLENVDEPPDVLRKVLDAVPDLRYCLDVGHAHLDQRTDGARQYLAVLGDRLALAHIHDNHGGQGEAGGEDPSLWHGAVDPERGATPRRECRDEGDATPAILQGVPHAHEASLRQMRRWTRP